MLDCPRDKLILSLIFLRDYRYTWDSVLSASPIKLPTSKDCWAVTVFYDIDVWIFETIFFNYLSYESYCCDWTKIRQAT